MCVVLRCPTYLKDRLLGRWRLVSQHSASLSCSDFCVMYYVMHAAGLLRLLLKETMSLPPFILPSLSPSPFLLCIVVCCY